MKRCNMDAKTFAQAKEFCKGRIVKGESLHHANMLFTTSIDGKIVDYFHVRLNQIIWNLFVESKTHEDRIMWLSLIPEEDRKTAAALKAFFSPTRQ